VVFIFVCFYSDIRPYILYYSPNRISGGECCRHYDKKKCEEQKEHHSYKIGTWNVRTLNQAGKLENLKMEMQKNEVSVVGVSEVRWKGQGEIKSGDYTVYYSGGERAERGVAIVVH
jgi:hypothetical protein